ncbi:hypothetical protein ACVWYF_002552 [Hymenobacter sp. UYAg731]
MLTAEAVLLTTLADGYGAPLAEYYFFPDHASLYICWHGQLTAAEVIRGVREGTRLLEQHSFQRVLNDKRDTGGDWSEALPWLEYEWLPMAVAVGLRAIAYILSPNLEAQIVSHTFVEAVQSQIQISLFTNEEDAQHWLETT